MADSDTPDESPSHSAAGGPDRVLAHLQGPLESLAQACLKRSLEQADDALFDRAQRDTSVSSQDSYFAAMRELRVNRQRISAHFEAGLRAACQRGLGQRPDWSDDIASEQWTLMGHDEEEEQVAIESAISRLRNRNAYALTELESRLASIAPLDGTGDDNPLDPATLLHAFANAIHQTAIAIQPRIIVYKLFEKQLLAGTGEVYTALNHKLEAMGLTPEDTKRVTQPDSGRRLGRASSQEASTPSANHAAEPARDRGPQRPGIATTGPPRDVAHATILDQLPAEQEVVGLLHELIATAQARTGSPEPAAGSSAESGSSPAADAPTVAKMLSVIQRSATQHQTEPLDPDQLKKLLQKGLARRHGTQRLERSVDQTIDIVSMLFEVILDDERLPSAIESLFARLQVPVLKIALTDSDFLACSAHPARRLFNALARSALGLVPTDRIDDDPVYQNIQAAVEKVVEDFNNDSGVFESALAAFETWQWRCGRGSVATGQTQGAAETRKARVDAVRAHAGAAIESRLNDAPKLPEPIDRLLREAWFKVLLINGIKHGVDSDLWSAQAGIADQIMQILTGPADGDRAQETAPPLPHLLAEVRNGLNGIMYSPAAIDEFLAALRQHGAGVDGASAERASTDGASGAGDQTAGTSDDNVVSASFRDSPSLSGTTHSSADEATGIDQQTALQLSAIPICSWFEFLGDDGMRRRACLQARVDSGHRYIFADRQGNRVAEYSVTDLVQRIRDGWVRPVEERALFDRAVESVIDRLRAQTG